MTDQPEWLRDLPVWARVLFFCALPVGAHLVARVVRRSSVWILGVGKEKLEGQYPRFATITTLLVSMLTFAVYFGAVGMLLNEARVPFTTYLASASVIGLAVGFGLQGLVQDLIIGLTLIFSDVLNVGDTVELAGQIGRVEKMGLRFTTLINFVGQSVYVPNRNIAQIGRYRKGVVRAWVDVQCPDAGSEETVKARISDIAQGMFRQHPRVLLTAPTLVGVFPVEPGGWRIIRMRFRLWPGQGALIEQTFKQRVLAAMRTTDAGYADWMITVTYGTD